jgi:hypothetical protein
MSDRTRDSLIIATWVVSLVNYILLILVLVKKP